MAPVTVPATLLYEYSVLQSTNLYPPSSALRNPYCKEHRYGGGLVLCCGYSNKSLFPFPLADFSSTPSNGSLHRSRFPSSGKIHSSNGRVRLEGKIGEPRGRRELPE